MTWYLQSLDMEVLKIILFGYTFPTKTIDGIKTQNSLRNMMTLKIKSFK